MKTLIAIATIAMGMVIAGSAFAAGSGYFTLLNDNATADHDINAISLNGGIQSNHGLVIDKSIAIVSHAGVFGENVDIGGNTSANGVGNTNIVNGVQVVKVTGGL